MPFGWDINKNDNKLILVCKELGYTLVTNDIAMRIKADSLDVHCERYKALNTNIEYTGYKEISMTDIEMAEFYQNLTENKYDCLTNEYIVIRDSNNEFKEIRRWTGKNYTEVYDKHIKTIAFGNKIKAKDEYQQMAIDSMINNTMTIISGKAGSGKTLLTLMAALYLIENGKYDTLVILFNPTKTRGSTEMGYYTGNLLDKAMQSNIGNILTTKFGDRYVVDTLLQQGKLKLKSIS